MLRNGSIIVVNSSASIFWIFKAGEMLGISLLDHIIIGDHRYVSFREKGIFDEYT